MTGFAVRHWTEDGKASTMPSILKKFTKGEIPYSYTNKEHEANLAKLGENIYVIEPIKNEERIAYALCYRYKAYNADKRAGGKLWLDKYKFRNSANPLNPDGYYFDNPIKIENSNFRDWYASSGVAVQGMIKIEDEFIKILDAIIENKDNNAKTFYSR